MDSLTEGEKQKLIDFLVEDFNQNEGKNANSYERRLLRARLNNFTVDELNLLKTGGKN